MKDDLTLADYWKIIKKKKKMIISLTFLVVIIILIVSLLLPKEFKSSAVIRSGKIDGEDVFTVIEMKNLIKSSIVLDPVFNRLYGDNAPSLDYFLNNNLQVEIVVQEFRINQIEQTNFVAITATSKKAENSKRIVDTIISEFFKYGNVQVEKDRQQILTEYNLTKNNIEKGIKLKESSLNQLSSDISNLETQIYKLSSKDLTTEGVSKSTLLSLILSDHKDRESEKEDDMLNLEKQLSNLELDLKTKLDNAIDFVLITRPEIPKTFSEPDILLNLGLALILGLVLSVILAIFKETINK